MVESRILKRNRKDHRTAKSDRRLDRLSELPDALLLVILSLLKMKDVVRTTVLSKRWKDLWTTVPCLDFCHDFYRDNWSFIECALSKWKGAKIFKLSIRYWQRYPPPSYLWLLIAMEKQVEELFIYSEPDMYVEYCALEPLYSCSSITKLCLRYCNMMFEKKLQWDQLKSLEFFIDELSDDAMNRILSGAPLLEELKFQHLHIIENFNIRSTSVKMLNISMFMKEDDIAEFLENAPVLNIWAPNLQSLELSGVWHTTCVLNVPSLTNATLGFEDGLCCMLDELSCYILREEMFRPAFLSLSHVQKLTLSDWWCVEFLVDEMKNENFVVFPKLEMLIFDPNGRNYNWQNECYSLAPNTIFPSLSPSLLQLKTIVITWSVCDPSILVVIEILLKMLVHLKRW